jgi:ribosomal protein S27AE
MFAIPSSYKEIELAALVGERAYKMIMERARQLQTESENESLPFKRELTRCSYCGMAILENRITCAQCGAPC